MVRPAVPVKADVFSKGMGSQQAGILHPVGIICSGLVDPLDSFLDLQLELTLPPLNRSCSLLHLPVGQSSMSSSNYPTSSGTGSHRIGSLKSMWLRSMLNICHCSEKKWETVAHCGPPVSKLVTEALLVLDANSLVHHRILNRGFLVFDRPHQSVSSHSHPSISEILQICGLGLVLPILGKTLTQKPFEMLHEVL